MTVPASPDPTHGLRGLAAEPFRVFFSTGALWSVVGVALWPLFYARALGFFPNVVHARIMVEAFGGAFVVGILGTYGPRWTGAPPLTVAELVWLVAWHLACGGCHLLQRIAWGDLCFIALLASLLVSLGVRARCFRRNPLPPPLLLVGTGLFCGIAGAAWHLGEPTEAGGYRLAGLLIHQGFLLLAVLGLAPLLRAPLPTSRGPARGILAATAAVFLVGSFFLEAGGQHVWGGVVRVVVATAYVAAEWHGSQRPVGTLAVGGCWALGIGWLGLALGPFHEVQRVSVAHLLYVSGFGLLLLLMASRVRFGSAGSQPGTWPAARVLVILGILTAATRAVPAWAPSTTVSHHIYAACMWGAVAVFWLRCKIPNRRVPIHGGSEASR